jgi:hypothetical protein
LYLTPLSPLHGIGATGTFIFKKQGQTCKVKKMRANVQLDLKTRVVLQLAQKKNTAKSSEEAIQLIFSFWRTR